MRIERTSADPKAYIDEFGRIAKTSNTVIIPADMASVGGMLAGMTAMLVLLVLRYILTSAFLAAAWLDYEDGSPILPFIPAVRYYCFGSLSGYGWAGAAACAGSLIWSLCLFLWHGSAALSLNACIVLLVNAACAWGFADRADVNRFLPVLFAAFGLPWLSLLYVERNGQ